MVDFNLIPPLISEITSIVKNKNLERTNPNLYSNISDLAFIFMLFPDPFLSRLGAVIDRISSKKSFELSIASVIEEVHENSKNIREMKNENEKIMKMMVTLKGLLTYFGGNSPLRVKIRLC